MVDKLNESLIEAAKNSSKREAFYKTLLSSDIYFLTNDEIKRAGSHVATEDTSFSLIQVKTSEGVVICPIFSSVSKIHNVFPNAANYVRLNAKIFFESTIGLNIILNPGSESYKDFSPQEIQALLDGTLFNHILKSGQQIMIGEAKDFPQELIEKLKECFLKFNEVSKAYVGQMLIVGDEPKPHLIIAISATGNLKNIFSTAGEIIFAYFGDKEIVDLVDLTSSSVFTEHFLNEKPFYQK